jgi:hypothetical protein
MAEAITPAARTQKDALIPVAHPTRDRNARLAGGAIGASFSKVS